ncbi:uncharacterized protein LOC135828763 [Sycon ciliatum]|uniref:uncharacterized protein LOC135828763 n=1 Tax=Sycon ciliatum TaxID=27933 RepID=UPI0020AC7A09|eukprot:scpid53870/ scgid18894/ Ankyrin repeat domain-containing protein 27
MAHEDLDFNPFYKALQRTHAGMYEQAQSRGWLVVIPHSSTIHAGNMNTSFAEMHILKPSPYFQDQYIAASKESYGFSIEDGVLRTEAGFDTAFSANILYEELAYSKDFKPFRILVTSRPLDPAYRDLGQVADADCDIGIPISRLVQERVALNDHTRLLKSLPSYDRIMIALDSAMVQFNNNYIVVDGYLEHTAKKLDRLCSQGVETVFTFVPALRKVALQDSRVEDSIRLAVESYIMGWVHQKVIRAVIQTKNEEDEEICERCKQCSGITPETLGVSKEFCCPLPEAMVELTALDSFTTPLEKLNCLKNTLELITHGVQKHMTQDVLAQDKGRDGPAASLVSDDLIPILVTVIIQAKCNRLATNLYYVENFHWASSSKANLGYSLVTFKAATEFILMTDMKYMIPATIEEDTTKDNPLAAAVAAASQGRVVQQVKHTSTNMENLRRAWESLDGNNRSSRQTAGAATAAATAPSSVTSQPSTAASSSASSSTSSMYSSRRASEKAPVSVSTSVSSRSQAGNGKSQMWRRNTWTTPASQQSVSEELVAAGVIPPSELHRSRTPNRSPITPSESTARPASALVSSTQWSTAAAAVDSQPFSSRNKPRRSTVGRWVDGTTEKLS